MSGFRKGFIAVGLVVMVLGLMGCTMSSSKTYLEVPIGGNLVSNGSFEEVSGDGLPVSFSVNKFQGTGKVNVDKSLARTGNHSIQILAGEDENSRTAVNQNVHIVAGETYQFTVWYRSPEGTQWDELPGHILVRLIARVYPEDGGAYLYKVLWDMDRLEPSSGTEISFEGQTGENLLISPDRSGEQTGWYPLEMKFTAEETAELQISLFSWRANEDQIVWYDDLSLIRLSESEGTGS